MYLSMHVTDCLLIKHFHTEERAYELIASTWNPYVSVCLAASDLLSVHTVNDVVWKCNLKLRLSWANYRNIPGVSPISPHTMCTCTPVHCTCRSSSSCECTCTVIDGWKYYYTHTLYLIHVYCVYMQILNSILNFA